MNKKEYIFQDTASNKFWNIEWNETSYTVTYGRVGSVGVSKTKEVSDILKEVEKLIKEKTKKGYVENNQDSFNDFNRMFAVVEKLKENSVGFLEIKPYEKEELKVKDSKFGGMPFLPKNTEIPKTKDGNQMFMITQINVSQLPKDTLPFDTGYIQFFIDGEDDCYGAEIDDPFINAGFKVVFQEETKEYYDEDEIESIYTAQSEEGIFSEPYALRFNKKTMGISTSDTNFNNEFVKTWNEMYQENEIEHYFDLDDDVSEKLFELSSGQGHKLFGYPFFTQEDPRSQKEAKEYKLLLQIDTDDEIDVCFGDCGVINFFIKDEDLKNKDFSKVYYTFDCY